MDATQENSDDSPTCAMCGRERQLTFHHLIPRKNHKNKWFKKKYTKEALHQGVDVCRSCHNKIHQVFDEKELGKEYNTLEKIMSNEDIQRFVEWVKKQDKL
jgi:5-methylcytosine-specific restriction endonuclease McrA